MATHTLVGFLLSDQFAELCGGIATVLFLFQYIPQSMLNYKKKSVDGFSSTGIIIKLIGSAFLAVNATLLGESWPVRFYGYGNICQHSFFMIQFTLYTPTKSAFDAAANKKKFLSWIGFILVPLTLGLLLPSTMPYTNSIKPLTQLISHWPQLAECVKVKSTHGCSLTTQAINLTGGILVCIVVPPKSWMTYMLYINSMFQAISLFSLAYVYDGLPRRRSLPPPPTEVC